MNMLEKINKYLQSMEETGACNYDDVFELLIDIKSNLERKSRQKEIKGLHPDAKYVLEEVSNLFNPKYITDSTLYDISKLLNSYPKESIIKAIKWARSDDFWSSNFLSIKKLNNVNRDKVKYIDVFLSKCSKEVYRDKRKVDGLTTEEINNMLNG